ncbi:hypothetical protein Y5S_03745 [Alcanivorax nanhaiticus]|uniref:Uncharacterized protein n=1 Tax=Alcanivorax nanhaiticus TaxID=1177154 RepID=A0A095SA57_9GAMM|nr:hypothetical protein [Alcanivorax nanhaiticus]KGD61407.1 hypothetical protein Y5S_03745 [Alcanivorax nanhaiticus]
MMDNVSYRWRKTTDINREYALFELLEGETPVLELGLSDEGILEVVFNPSVSGRIFELEHFLKLLDEGRALAERDR